VTDPSLRDIRQELMLGGFASLPEAHSRSVLRLAQLAVHSGYPELC
jgi:hypothetical protein